VYVLLFFLFCYYVCLSLVNHFDISRGQENAPVFSQLIRQLWPGNNSDVHLLLTL